MYVKKHFATNSKAGKKVQITNYDETQSIKMLSGISRKTFNLV